MIDFKVDNTALQTVSSVEITANFEETKTALLEMMKPYKSLVVTEDGIASAKADRAKINKVVKVIDEYRKTVKKVYLKPYEDFEKKCKELTAVCTSASGNIDTQVKKFEQAKKEEKIARLRKVFTEATENSGVKDIVTFQQVYNKRWENATFSEEEAVNEITSKIEKIKSDVKAIKSLKSDFEPSLLDIYVHTHDLGTCIEKHNEFTEIKRREAERKAKIEEAKRIAEEEEAKRLSKKEKTDEEEFNEAAQADEEATDISEAVEVYTLRFEVTATREQLVALSRFMKQNAIAFTKA